MKSSTPLPPTIRVKHYSKSTIIEKSRPQWTILSLLKWATTYFQSRNIDSPRATAEILLSVVLEMKRIADWADLYYMNMLCHNMCTPVGTVASAHACMAIRSFLALESDSVELPYWQDLVRWDGPFYKDGYLEVPNKPGLGVECNEQLARKFTFTDKAPFDMWWGDVRRRDGTVIRP